MTALPFRDIFPFGTWESDDAPSRWLVDLNENGCAWTERRPSGDALLREVKLLRTARGWRIDRQNDAEVLRLLGATPALLPAILAASPEPSFIILEVRVDDILAVWHGLRWTLDAHGGLASVVQPGTAPSTIKSYRLVRRGDDSRFFSVTRGQLTFDSEGREGDARYHSRWLHRPPGASGVTLGRGYDMKERSGEQIEAQLTAAGLDPVLARSMAQGAAKSGADADKFVMDNREPLGNITPGQQKRLFESTYEEAEADVKRISAKADVVEKYGAVNFDTVHPRLREIVVDLRFRGDYSPASRAVLQKAFAANDIVAFASAISDRSHWPSVPEERYRARVAYLPPSV